MSTVISVENLGKKFTLHHQQREQYTALRDVIANGAASFGKKLLSPFTPSTTLRAGLHPSPAVEDFWALKDVSFEVKQGDRIGIIGRNGAGKSTLLKILSRITEPTTGRVRIKGRVASLLEVGTGFHPELTGRENIYLNGAILGMGRAEIKKKFDEIVDFAEIEKFLDTPVKRYSSGMYVRLAFAVAAHLEPEILVVDEVLAVGDAQFQKKCLGKMEDVSAKKGRTVLFVSHQMDMIRALCNRCILINNGMLSNDGDTDFVIDSYSADYTNSGQSSFEIHEESSIPIQILKGRINNGTGLECCSFDIFDSITIEFEYVVHKVIPGTIINFELKNNNAVILVSFDTDTRPDLLFDRTIGYHSCRIDIPCPLLKPGFYSISPGTGIANSNKIQHLEDALSFEVTIVSMPSSVLSFAEKRPGVVASYIDWYNLGQIV